MEMPSSISGEQSIIGALLLDNDAIDKCSTITEDSFFDFVNGKIFSAITSIISSGKPADIITVSDYLDSRSIEFGGIGALAEFQQCTPSAAAVGRYVKIVHDRHVERQMIHASAEIADLAMANNGESIECRQAKALSLIESIADDHAYQKSESTASEAMHELLQDMQDRMSKEPGTLGGMSVGLKAVDDILDGLKNGELIVIGGRSSMGKSVLAEIVGRTSAKDRKKVRVHSFEMPAKSWIARGAASNNSIALKRILEAKLNDDEYDKFSAFVGMVNEWDLKIDTDIIGWEQIALRARAHKRKYGLDLLLVDHMHLIPLPGRDTVRELGDISSGMKRLARELNIPVVLVAQLNRGNAVQVRAPTMTDLRGSGSIEQDADVILLVHRPAEYDDSKPASEAQIIVAKNRNGETGDVLVGWRGDYVRFQDKVDSDYQPKKQHYAGSSGYAEDDL